MGENQLFFEKRTNRRRGASGDEVRRRQQQLLLRNNNIQQQQQQQFRPGDGPFPWRLRAPLSEGSFPQFLGGVFSVPTACGPTHTQPSRPIPKGHYTYVVLGRPLQFSSHEFISTQCHNEAESILRPAD